MYTKTKNKVCEELTHKEEWRVFSDSAADRLSEDGYVRELLRPSAAPAERG